MKIVFYLKVHVHVCRNGLQKKYANMQCHNGLREGQ